jgi:hypothetical protein
LLQIRTNEHLQVIIVDSIDKALSGRSITHNGPFQSAIESQAQIGWLGLLQGHWSQTWQQEYKQTYEEPERITQKDKNKRHFTNGTLAKTAQTNTMELYDYIMENVQRRAPRIG